MQDVDCVDDSILNVNCVNEGVVHILDVDCVDEILIDTEYVECMRVGDIDCIHMFDQNVEGNDHEDESDASDIKSKK